ncbi:MAG: CHAT domain-containing protein, partial [Chitinophagaceae bacterium]|nr:CHAT domain-containing protein [Chitinophagaceae bacterium]
MSVVNLRLKGTKHSASPLPEKASDFFTLEASYEISPPTRSDVPEQKIALDDKSLVEIVLDDGTVWFGDLETLEKLFPDMALAKRGDTNEWTLPFEIDDIQTDRNIIRKVALKVLNIFTRKGAGVAVKAIAQKLEEKQLETDRTRVFRLDHSFKLVNIDKEVLSDGTYLLFIHGTASSTSGSFDKLMGSGVWEHIKETYKSNILTLQHRTLTENPLENLLVLINKLPANCTLDVISHSRGGLVADLLCRFAVNKRGFDDAEILLLEKEKRDSEVALLKELEKIMVTKRISVRRQVRVACPARGTTLASDRLDTLLNVMLNLIGSANPFVIGFKELIAAVIDTKNQTEILPGIEAMNPESPFVKALNFPGSSIEIPSPLMVIAGNSKISFKLRGLLVLLSKLFYLEGNDLIVNTSSMYQGARRAGDKSFYYLESTSETHHFAYFSNHSSRTAILSALKYTGEGRLPGFEPLGKTLLPDVERNALLGLDGGKVFKDEVTGKKPIVILLPGIMGSNLQVKDNVVWINYLRFLTGELTSLQYTQANNKQIKAHSLVRTSYKKLVDFLSAEYDVVTFPFDWRKPLNETTDQLDLKLKELMQVKQPIKMIAHSMGGVLVRDFMVYHSNTWKQLNALNGFQLLMLGSPLGGSYRIPYVLFGFDDIIKKLASIDIRNSKRDLLDVFCNLPGLLSLLPMQKHDDFGSVDTWQQMQMALGEKDWPIPEKEVLNGFARYRERILNDSSKLDYKNVIYVAGACRKNKSTPCGYKIESGKLTFLATYEGDESVTWETGIPKELKEQGKVYFSNVTHGELANDASLFPVITELLQKGSTTKLSEKPSLTRGAETMFAIKPSNDLDMSERGIEKTILGLGGDDQYKPMEIPLKVSVTNGDLSFAHYPILVGHFNNDGIVSAEKAIDDKLGGELTRRHKLGLHPDLIEENEVLLTDRKPGDAGLQGVIIVGLGYPGELTPFLLMRTIERGISKYLSIINVKSENQAWQKDRPVIGISTLLIGGSYGGLTIDGSINAILSGIQQANINFRNIYGNEVRLIEEVEIIELYRDRALSAIYVIRQIEKDESRSLNIVLNQKIAREKLGPRLRIPLDSRKDWWTRVTVRRKDESEIMKEKGSRDELRMTISTTGAREESRSLLTASHTLMSMIKEMGEQNNWSPAHAITLFELLIPIDFKEQLRRQNNILWIVDKYSAAIPWELMMDKSAKEQPLCVNAGMVRQLSTRDSRIKIFPSGERNALVVADPELNGFLSQLGGAYREGMMAADMFKNNAYHTHSLLKANAGEILNELMCRNYQVIHLAGHGVFDPERPESTGMVIGNGTFLTVAEIAQMDTVPELVFVNCCYLGATNENAEMNRQGRYRLAANIGTQLIENGVKAVVVAGWAVQDNAALSFAQTFYQNIFSGVTFGESVKR